jgi:hypothetical protein
MKLAICFLTSLGLLCGLAFGTVSVDEDSFGKSLGGWRKKSKNTAEYSLSGSIYRTYRPETSKTPEGGIFLSIRIDHVRGWLSSDDHAILEITVGPEGTIESAKSNIAIQGKSITSDVIVGVSAAGQVVTNVDQAVQVGTDLVADLTAKLLRENIVEAGRVSFPAALRHNYNLLYQALRVNGVALGADQATPPSSSPPSDNTNPAPVATSQASIVIGPAKTEQVPAQPIEEENTVKQDDPPAAKPVPEHEPLEVAPYIDPKPDPLNGSIPPPGS